MVKRSNPVQVRLGAKTNTMPIPHCPRQLRRLFIVSDKVLNSYQSEKEGAFTINCKMVRLRDQGERVFKVVVHGFRGAPFYFTAGELSSYVSFREFYPLENQVSDLFHHLEESLLTVLQGSGYGDVVFNFEKERERPVLIIRLTISRRHRL